MPQEERVIQDPTKLEWVDAAQMLTLPEGVKAKVLSDNPETGRRDVLWYFPPGYVEPRHTHKGTHSDVLIEGRWIIEGTEVGPGGYIYGPADVPHGPFECPDGCLVFAHFEGPLEHDWPPKEAVESAAASAPEPRVIADPNTLEWQEGSKRFTLPEGVKYKILDENPKTGRLDMLAYFPPGYVEPRHTHKGAHSDVLVEGRWIIEGTEVGPGGFIYGPPDVPHGPFECPDGCLVFASFHGPVEHDWD